MTMLRTATLWGLRLATAVLFVWIPMLAVTLKAAGVPRGEAAAWVALDLAELCGLLATLDCARRGSARLSLVASASAALFLLDAVVDTATASASPTSLATATAMALVAELPVATGCAFLAGAGQGCRVPTPSRMAE